MGLGDARSDIVNLLSAVMSQQKAQDEVTSLETLIRQKAQEGTDAAITAKLPELKATVHTETAKTLKPLFIGAMVVGGLGIVTGTIAIIMSRKSKPKESPRPATAMRPALALHAAPGLRGAGRGRGAGQRGRRARSA